MSKYLTIGRGGTRKDGLMKYCSDLCREVSNWLSFICICRKLWLFCAAWKHGA